MQCMASEVSEPKVIIYCLLWKPRRAIFFTASAPVEVRQRRAAEGKFRRRRRCGALRRGNSAGGDGAERCGGAIPQAETVRRAAEGQFRRRRPCGAVRKGNSAGGELRRGNPLGEDSAESRRWAISQAEASNSASERGVECCGGVIPQGRLTYQERYIIMKALKCRTLGA